MNAREVGKAIQLLLVEDNPGDVDLARDALEDGEVQVNLSVAVDGEDAMAFLRKTGKHTLAPRPDLILLDLNLPRKNGREVLAEIKADADLKRIPVVVLTTSQAQEDVRNSYDCHANCYIVKPVDLRQFRRALQAMESFWFTIVRLPPKEQKW